MELRQPNPLCGTWKLKSHVATTDMGERTTPYGERPSGYLTYSADGRMHAIGAADGRAAPKEAATTDAERLRLYETMFAYAGTYTLEADKVTHHVDISWNHLWTGTDQIRFYELAGNTLILTTTEIDPISGTETRYAVTWEKVKGRC